MLIRFTLSALCSLALANALAAQPYLVSSPGYATTETTIANPPATTFVGGADWDPTGSDLYYWDGVNIRRFDTTTNAPAATPLFTVPVVFGPYVDVIKFDPFNPNDLYVSESGAFTLYRLTRSGVDSVASQSSGVLGIYLFDMAFDSAGRLLASGADATTFAAGIYLIDPVTLTERLLIDLSLLNSNGSGPIAFDAAGNLYSAIPPAFGSQTPGQLVRFDRAEITAAILALPPTPGPAPLDDTDATLVIGPLDGFTGMGHMGFRTEDGQEFLYYVVSAGTTIYRASIALKQSAVFMQGAAPLAGLSNFSSVLAIESRTAPFAPFSGGTSRLGLVFGAQNSSFAIVNQAIATVKPAAPATGAASLAITNAPAFLRNGIPFDLTVEVRNSSGAPISTGAAVKITATGAASGQLLGFTVAATAGGIVSFSNLVFAGSDAGFPAQLQLRAELVGVTSMAPALTANLTVYALLGSVAFTAQPSVAAIKQPFGVTVQVRDNFGALVTAGPDASAVITLSLFSGTGTLVGNLTMAATNGVATFTNLRLEAAGDYVLRARSSGMNDALSAAIHVSMSEATGSDGSCSAAETGGKYWLVLLAPLALLLRPRRKQVDAG